MISAMVAYCNTGKQNVSEQTAKQNWESEEPYFEVTQGDTVLGIMSLAEEKVPKAELASFRLELFDDRDDRLPARCITRELSPGQPFGRSDLLLQTRESYE
jgi:hypothetical protein